MADGRETLFDLVDVYVAVARLPGMGSELAARRQVYAKAIDKLFAPDPTGPLTLATHGGRVKLRLVKPEFFATAPPGAVVPHMAVPGLGLVAIYVLDLMGNLRFLTDWERNDLGLDVKALHDLALENLRKDFPCKMVAEAISGKGGTAICSGDGFDAARLLLIPECLKKGESLVALVPHRDMLVLGPADLEHDRSKLEAGLRALDCQDHPPLLNQPVRVTSAGFEMIDLSGAPEPASA
jgi:hypothetical protein